MDIDARLNELGLDIPTAPKPLASYIPSLVADPALAQLLVSGQVPLRDGAPIATGLVGETVGMELAQECAAQCAMNALGAAKAALDGDLSRIDRVLRLGCFVACGPGFTDHPKVANGASDLMERVFGERGRHVRAAVGVASLPLGVPVEIEFAFAVRA